MINFYILCIYDITYKESVISNIIIFESIFMKAKYLVVAIGVMVSSYFLFIKKANLIKRDMRNDSLALIVGTSADYQPFAFVDPKTHVIVGFDIDVVTEIARRLDKKMELKDVPFASLIFGLLSGGIDIVAAGMSPTPKRAETVAFSVPYIEPDPFVMIMQTSRQDVQNLDDLVGKKVAVNSGYTAEAYLANKEGVELMRLVSPAESMMALKAGAVDVFVCARSVAKTILHQSEFSHDYQAVLIPDTGDGCALAINKNNSELLDSVNRALEAMEQDGTLADLKAKWSLS